MGKLTKGQGQKNMQLVEAAGSKIEVTLVNKLFARGHRYRKRNSKMFEQPNFSFGKYKITIFADGGVLAR